MSQNFILIGIISLISLFSAKFADATVIQLDLDRTSKITRSITLDHNIDIVDEKYNVEGIYSQEFQMRLSVDFFSPQNYNKKAEFVDTGNGYVYWSQEFQVSREISSSIYTNELLDLADRSGFNQVLGLNSISFNGRVVPTASGIIISEYIKGFHSRHWERIDFAGGVVTTTHITHGIYFSVKLPSPASLADINLFDSSLALASLLTSQGSVVNVTEELNVETREKNAYTNALISIKDDSTSFESRGTYRVLSATPVSEPNSLSMLIFTTLLLFRRTHKKPH